MLLVRLSRRKRTVKAIVTCGHEGDEATTHGLMASDKP